MTPHGWLTRAHTPHTHPTAHDGGRCPSTRCPATSRDAWPHEQVLEWFHWLVRGEHALGLGLCVWAPAHTIAVQHPQLED